MMFLRMKGPYKLGTEIIDVNVTLRSPGNYVLGKKDGEGKFRVGYVGRSDSDVRLYLKSRADKANQLFSKANQLFFKFSYAASPEEAFEKECRIYHDFHPPGNYSHPTPPKGTTWRCPRCDIFGMGSAGIKKKSFVRSAP